MINKLIDIRISVPLTAVGIIFGAVSTVSPLIGQDLLGKPINNPGIQVDTPPSAIRPNQGSGSKTKTGSSDKTETEGSATKDGGSATKVTDSSVTQIGLAALQPSAGLPSLVPTLVPRPSNLNLDSIKISDEQIATFKAMNFEQLTAAIRTNERKINASYVNAPIADHNRLNLVLAQIARFKKENETLSSLVEPAAIALFRENPSGNLAAAATVMDLLAGKLSPRDRNSKYDPKSALQLVETILEIKGDNMGMEAGKTPDPDSRPLINVIYQGYLACYGMEAFDAANEYLTRLENMEIGLQPIVREQFELTREAWKRETEQRAIDAQANLPVVKLETEKGDIVIELFEDQAPETVNNFVSLVEAGFYDGLEFFQVVPSLYARTGCSANDGTTIPGYRIRNEFENARGHFAGTVVMHNDGEDTAGSQFLILHRPDPTLVGQAVALGRVTSGMNVVYDFKPVNRIRTLGGQAIVINKATVINKRDHEYKPVKLEGDLDLPVVQPNAQQ